MHILNYKTKRHRNVDEELRPLDGADHPRFSRGTWVAVAIGGSALVGGAATVYGASKQAGAISDANAANAAATDKQNNAAWQAWLYSRGIQPNTPVEYGTIPKAGEYTATNTKLPAWANVKTTGAGNSFLMKNGNPVSPAPTTFQLSGAS